mgnify:CR=1 FL=1
MEKGEGGEREGGDGGLEVKRLCLFHDEMSELDKYPRLEFLA